MKTRIGDIAQIQTGVFAKPSGEGDLVYLQSKHFDEMGRLQTVLHPDLKPEGIAARHILQVGDVLFAAKGSKNFAAVFEDHNRPAVASTSFFVIKPEADKVLPQYLVWLLNSPAIQLSLKGQAIGTSIPSISKQVLEYLEVPLPELWVQESVLHISNLRNKEMALQKRIELLKEKRIQHLIYNAIK